MPNFTGFGRRPTMRNIQNNTSGDQSSGLTTPDGNDDSSSAGIRDSEYARKCRELMNIIKRLFDLGAENMFPVPRVTVIGGQSAGKSSLVEAVSGINVPRDSGTCTRCPMECVMSSSGTTWSCQISLRLKYNANGKPVDQQTISFSPLITNPAEVELWIRRAQAAILYPNRLPSEFKDKSEDDLRNLVRSGATLPDSKMLKFSKNMVLVELKDPGLTDLLFIDLPGLIQNEEEDVINLVRTLVVDQIGGEHSENNIILITIPMSDDIENQQAVKLARECDPEGVRTIGNLFQTRLARVLSDHEINGEMSFKEHKLTHGYYCVRLPDDAQRASLSRTEFQKLALQYFDTKAPWSQMSARDRFGVPNLVSDVSKLLVELIEKNIPKLKTSVERFVLEAQEELQTLPAPPAKEPVAEISTLVNSFCTTVTELVFGKGEDTTLAKTDRKLYAEFKRAIWSTSYDFRPFVNCKYWEGSGLDNDEPFDSPCIPSPERSGSYPDVRKIYYFSDVREVIESSIGWELPGHVPFEATKKLVRDTTSKWRAPSVACFNAIYNNLWYILEGKISTIFKQYSKLEKFISSIVRRELDCRKEVALVKLEDKIKHEGEPVWTQNYHYLAAEKLRWRLRYEKLRGRNTSDDLLNASPSRPSTYAASRSAVNSSTPVYTRKYDLERDEYEEEIDLMAGVQAYFKVAYKATIAIY
ncbi:hypothetical protein VKT23_006272 [Stygiomarasmius scandens]|uniref:Dynamin-type G domain-containing protein n=1 Tax=Marasmiellus scandens TaxID=2682957 RepID=A0ABR1JMA6_9AGAR